jgi:F-type H+-transporting ATPase subunit delta
MISSAVFTRYARALSDVTLEKGEDDVVIRDLDLYRQIFNSVPELLDAFDSPAIPREAKENLLFALLEKYPVSTLTTNFLRVLLSHYRIRYFQEIFEHYVKTVNERRGIVSAQVTTAAVLAESELGSLRTALAGATGKTVTLDVEEDSDLVGGVVVQIGSTVYDGSIRSQLCEIRRRLTSV